jgi:broad specificity phosphatase PhoE
VQLIIVRHGETTWNDQARYQGQQDIPLNSRGRLQAACLAERLASEPIDAVYSSDLTRATETAQTIAARIGTPIAVDPRWREIHLGTWQGMTYAEVHRRYFRESDPAPVYPVKEPAPGGESLGQLRTRLLAAVESVCGSGADLRVAVITHGACLKVLMCTWLGMELDTHWKLSFGAGSISRATLLPGGVVITGLNERDHLISKEMP